MFWCFHFWLKTSKCQLDWITVVASFRFLKALSKFCISYHWLLRLTFSNSIFEADVSDPLIFISSIMFGVIFSSSSRPFLPAWLCHSCSWYYNSLTCLSQLYRLALLFSVFGLLEWADLHYFFLWMDDKKSVNFSSSLSTDIFYIIFSITFRNVIRLKCYIGPFAFLLPGLVLVFVVILPGYII